MEYLRGNILWIQQHSRPSHHLRRRKLFFICPLGVVKAFYLRGKAHVEVWNEAEARQDFSRVLDLDPGMKKAVKKELAVLNMRMEEKNQEDRDKYKGMF